MKTLQQQRLEFLQDTVNYYSEDTNRRAVSKNYCVYYDEITGKKCAIGRHIKPEEYCSEFEGANIIESDIFFALPDHLKELGRQFLSEVQYLHDNKFNWNTDKGLSNEGKVKVQDLIDIYCS